MRTSGSGCPSSYTVTFNYVPATNPGDSLKRCPDNNGDDVVNMKDIQYIINHFNCKLESITDSEGKFIRCNKANLIHGCPAGSWDDKADLNGDCIVNMKDINFPIRYFNCRPGHCHVLGGWPYSVCGWPM